MTRPNHQSLALIAVALATFCLQTRAQEVLTPNTSTRNTEWLSLRSLPSGEKLDIVLTASPEARHHCDLKGVDIDAMTCAGHENQKYLAADVQAIIVRARPATGPHKWRDRLMFIGGFGGAGYGIYLLALLGPWGAAAAGLMSLLALSILGAIAFSYDPPPGVAAQPEAVIYSKPGSTYAGFHGK